MGIPQLSRPAVDFSDHNPPLVRIPTTTRFFRARTMAHGPCTGRATTTPSDDYPRNKRAAESALNNQGKKRAYGSETPRPVQTRSFKQDRRALLFLLRCQNDLKPVRLSNPYPPPLGKRGPDPVPAVATGPQSTVGSAGLSAHRGPVVSAGIRHRVAPETVPATSPRPAGGAVGRHWRHLPGSATPGFPDRGR